jgi:hypothetical protein
MAKTKFARRQNIVKGLDQYRKVRDQASEREFAALYGA